VEKSSNSQLKATPTSPRRAVTYPEGEEQIPTARSPPLSPRTSRGGKPEYQHPPTVPHLKLPPNVSQDNPHVSPPVSPPLSPRSLENYQTREDKIFHFHYRGIQKDLKVYVGTPVNLIWRTLFQQLGILQPGGTNFEQLLDSVALLDNDGCPVVFSPEHIPHDEKLYVQFTSPRNLPRSPLTHSHNRIKSKSNSGVSSHETSEEEKKASHTDEESNETSSENNILGEDREFCWDAKWNTLYCGYTLSDGDRCIKAGTSQVARSSSMPILISNRSFKKGTGVYKWHVVFNEEAVYHCAGIVSAEEISFPRKCATFGNHFPSVPWFHKTSPMGIKNTTIILDTNRLKVTINGNTFDNLPDVVYAGVCFKMSQGMEAQLFFDVQRNE